MTRLRWLLGGLAAVLFVLTGLLVHRALMGAMVEQEQRHQAVADHLFQEMERFLDEFLDQEESRPFGHYRYFYVPDSQVPGSLGLVTSPLAQPSRESFVLAYFQVDPDGSVHSPMRPRNDELARLANGWQPSAELDEVQAQLTAVVEWLPGIETGPGEPPADAQQQAGTTVLRAKASRVYAPVEQAPVSPPFNYLQDVRGLKGGRAPRGQQRQSIPSVAVQQFADNAGSTLESQLISACAAPPEPAGQAVLEPLHDLMEPSWEDPGPITVALEPMTGRRLDESRMVLHRSVSVQGQTYLQGLVLGLPELHAALTSRALAGTELAARAFIEWPEPPTAAFAPRAGHAFAFQRRFDEPLADLVAVAHLQRLPGVTGTPYVLVLSALLLVVGGLGFAAVHRLAAVTVGFAERRSNFVSAVTHELKAPLTAIRMYGEMLRDGIVPSEQKRQQYYGTITAETERLSRLIDNVLELARLEKGQRELEPCVGDVLTVLDEACEILEPHARELGFRLVVRGEPELPAVRFDRDALVQVVLNLVDNAFKYSKDADEKVVELQAGRRGDSVVVHVSDRGPGIAGEHVGRIFEPFYRCESELTRTSKGTGIGLALVKGLIEGMGGEVAAINRAGGGLSVEMTLPLTA